MSVRIENGSDHIYIGWVHSTIPVPPGLATDGDLANFTLAGLPTVMTPLKWHWSNGSPTSVALVKARSFVILQPGEVIERNVVPGANWAGAYVLGDALARWWVDPNHDLTFGVLARFQGDPAWYVGTAGDDLQVMEYNGSTAVFRMRNHFVRFDDPQQTHPLSLTLYLSTQSYMNSGKCTLALGNDTLEQPVNGGIHVQEAYLVAWEPFRFQPMDPDASGILGPFGDPPLQVWQILGAQDISDGMEYATDFAFCVADDDSDFAVDSMKAMAEFPIYGMADFFSWQASQAAGPVGFVPDPRFPSFDAGRQAVDFMCDPVIAPENHGVGTVASLNLGTVNSNPPITGDQPDFGSNIPVFYLQAIQTGSVCPIRRHIIGAKRDSWRPSYYWDNALGHAERVRANTYPDLFFWSGRVHYDPSWNPGYPMWNTRSPYNGFVDGPPVAAVVYPGQPPPVLHWGTSDNQHYGNNGLRAVYELTADPYVEDLLKANVSLLYFNFFTAWMTHTEAERTGRTMKEAVALATLFPGYPPADLLRQKIYEKNQVYLNVALNYRNQYGAPAVASVVNDARVALTMQFPDQEVHMAWQTGFNMEGMAASWKYLGDPAAAQVMDMYLDAAHVMFLPDGSPKTYYLMSDPNQYTLGGIGISWWSGWVLANQARPGRPNTAFIANQVTDMIRSGLLPPPPGQFWADSDRWRCFQ